MTDLLDVIPNFQAERYTQLLTGLETHLITTSDLLTLDVVELARRAHLSIPDLKVLINDVISTLHTIHRPDGPHSSIPDKKLAQSSPRIRNGRELAVDTPVISTLDDLIDASLGGGIAPGYITEVTGESGAGKTQFLLNLLLTAQLPAPQGLNRGTIYISTEHALPTQRLQAILVNHPRLKDHWSPPSLKRVLSIQIPDLETQDHILTYQLPVAVRSHNIGLIVIDSIAANYRAELEASKSSDAGKSQAKALGARSVDLIRTGALLREIARTYDCAIVVANQVSDRFEQRPWYAIPDSIQQSQSSNQAEGRPGAEPSNGIFAPTGSTNGPPQSSQISLSHLLSSPSPMLNRQPLYDGPTLSSPHDPRLALDYQMRFFTGWGDSDQYQSNMKTPTLGLTWTNQIACRIVILRESTTSVVSNIADSIYDQGRAGTGPLPETELGGAEWSRRRWKRYVKVVFGSWIREVEEGNKGVEFEVWAGGIRAVAKP